jgi:RHS repeat-associated protein
MQYDAENRLVEATNGAQVTKYGYGADGMRVWKERREGGELRETVRYFYGAEREVVAEAEELAGVVRSGGTWWLSGDRLGSTRLMTKTAVGGEKCWDYLPFGAELWAGLGGRDGCHPVSATYPVAGAPDGERVKFGGKERDGETGVDHSVARMYGPGWGRFLSPDAPGMDQHVEDPQSWNLYAFVRNNPLRFVDPSGLTCVWVGPLNDRGERIGENDPNNWKDDGKGGQPCSEAFEAQKVDVEARRDLQDDKEALAMERPLRAQASLPLELPRVPPPGPLMMAVPGPQLRRPRGILTDDTICFTAPSFLFANPALFGVRPPFPADPLMGNGPGGYWMPSLRTKNGGYVRMGASRDPKASGFLDLATSGIATSQCLMVVRGNEK